jgi:hypothetical protein
MSTSAARLAPALAEAIVFDDDSLSVRLLDGRVIEAPLEWFPRLRAATDEQRAHWRLIGGGVGFHWPDIDEDISVEGLLAH